MRYLTGMEHVKRGRKNVPKVLCVTGFTAVPHLLRTNLPAHVAGLKNG